MMRWVGSTYTAVPSAKSRPFPCSADRGLSPSITYLTVSSSPHPPSPQTPSSPSDRSPVRNNSQSRLSTRPNLCDRHVGSPSRSLRTNRTVPDIANQQIESRVSKMGFVLTLNSVILNPSTTNGLSETIVAPSFRSRKRLTRSALRDGGKTSLLTSFILRIDTVFSTLSRPGIRRHTTTSASRNRFATSGCVRKSPSCTSTSRFPFKPHIAQRRCTSRS